MRSINLRNIFLIARREYLERVRTKAFMIFTLLMPAIMFGFSVVPSLLVMSKSGGTLHIAVVSADAKLAQSVKVEILRSPSGAEAQQEEKLKQQKRRSAQSGDVQYTVDVNTDASEKTRTELQKRLDAKEMDGFIWLDGKAIAEHTTTYTGRDVSNFVELGKLQGRIRTGVLRYQLAKKGFDPNELQSFMKPFDVSAIKWEGGKASQTDQGTQLLAVVFLVITLYVTVLMYGVNVMRAVLEEKTTRVMEVLMASVSATDLMAGKIMGVGAVGLTQVAAWFTMASVAAAPGAFSLAGKIREANFSGMTAVYFVIYFLLGYFLYSSMCAALGALVTSEQEAQQLQFFVIMPLIVSVMFMMFVMMHPNDPRVVALSLIPFCTPVLMFIRTIVSPVPAWQVALSIGLMLGTIACVVWVCARIYRVGALMHGKRPTLPEIVKWVRYA